jgi:hypothetical protein
MNEEEAILKQTTEFQKAVLTCVRCFEWSFRSRWETEKLGTTSGYIKRNGHFADVSTHPIAEIENALHWLRQIGLVEMDWDTIHRSGYEGIAVQTWRVAAPSQAATKAGEEDVPFIPSLPE